MVAPTAALLRQRRSRQLVSPHLILHLLTAVERALGSDHKEALLETADIGIIPANSDLVSELKAARLHQALRERHPNQAPELLAEAGRMTGEALIAAQVTDRAKVMLGSAPWPLAAWLVSKTIRQNAGLFSGTGGFRVTNTLHCELEDNPLVRGETSGVPVCHWNRALFEAVYKTLVHPQLECFETDCCATGASACRFEMRLRGPDAMG